MCWCVTGPSRPCRWACTCADKRARTAACPYARAQKEEERRPSDRRGTGEQPSLTLLRRHAAGAYSHLRSPGRSSPLAGLRASAAQQERSCPMAGAAPRTPPLPLAFALPARWPSVPAPAAAADWSRGDAARVRRPQQPRHMHHQRGRTDGQDRWWAVARATQMNEASSRVGLRAHGARRLKRQGGVGSAASSAVLLRRGRVRAPLVVAQVVVHIVVACRRLRADQLDRRLLRRLLSRATGSRGLTGRLRANGRQWPSRAYLGADLDACPLLKPGHARGDAGGRPPLRRTSAKPSTSACGPATRSRSLSSSMHAGARSTACPRRQSSP